MMELYSGVLKNNSTNQINDLESITFDSKPNIKEIIAAIANYNPYLMDNDREFCYLFDKIALNNGYLENDLPLYWTIGREIFRFKQEHKLSAEEKTNQIPIQIEILDIDKNIICSIKFDKDKPSTKKIIEAIWNYDNSYFNSDRKLVKLFDTIALHNGYTSQNLPKYWNIIRVVFDFKKDKKLPPIQNKEIKNNQQKLNKIDLKTDIKNLNLSIRSENLLLSIGIDSLDKLITLNLDDFKQRKSVGHNTINEIEQILLEYDLQNNNLIECNDNLIHIDYRILNIKLEELKFSNSTLIELNELKIFTIGEFLNTISSNKLNAKMVREFYDSVSKYGITRYEKYSPAIMTLPDMFYERPGQIFDNEILTLIDKFNFKNIGLFAESFPDILIQDEELMYKPEVFEYIDKITAKFKSIGITKLPVKLSCFQKEELNELRLDELLSKDFLKDLVGCVTDAIKDLPDKEKDVIIQRYGLNNCSPKTLDEVGKEKCLTRERVRQIQNKGLVKLLGKTKKQLSSINNEIKRLFDANYEVIELKASNNRCWPIVEDLLNRLGNIYFRVDFDFNLILKSSDIAEDLLEKDNVSLEIKEKIEKVLYKNYLIINGQRIKNDKNDILKFFIKLHCQKPVKFDNFQALYMDFLITSNLSHRTDLLYDDSTLYNKLSNASSIGGTITGRGADWVIVDDPIKPADALSENLRTKTNEWYSNTLSSRLNDKEHGKIMLIMQRLHEDDLTGHLLNSDLGFKLLKLQGIAEKDEEWGIKRPFGKVKTVKRNKGEALHPERESIKQLLQQKREMGTSVFAGQYQQDPMPLEGGIIKAEWLHFYSKANLLRLINTGDVKVEYLIQSWDTAYGTNNHNDYSACVTLIKDSLGIYYVLDVFRGKLEFPDLIRKIVRLEKEAREQYRESVEVLIENKGPGQSLIQELKHNHNLYAKKVEPEYDKEARLLSVSHLIENGRCKFPNDKPYWWHEFEKEMLIFPNGKHDDQCDALSQALNYKYRPPVRSRVL